METELLERAFRKMGARLSVGEQSRWDRRFYSIDIGRDKEGEVFVFKGVTEIDAKVIQVDAHDRHLLLHVERGMGRGKEKAKFLCGHDERHWFVAAIPETESVTNIDAAKDALRPKGLPKKGNWIRQGEWFFIPQPRFVLPRGAVTVHDEPLVRRTSDGRGGKPHIVTEVYRFGGDSVWVHPRVAPQGFTATEYDAWKLANPKKAAKSGSDFRAMVRNATVYVRGEVRHPDHRTVKLGTVWHEVQMNREAESVAMRNMVFLD